MRSTNAGNGSKAPGLNGGAPASCGLLEKRVWPTLPAGEKGRRLTRAEEDEILGFGPVGRMTLDSSALIAILFAEPGYLELVDRILAAEHVRIGAPTLVETSLVFAGRRRARGVSETWLR